MDNVQKRNICTNVPSSQTFRYLNIKVSKNLTFQLLQLKHSISKRKESISKMSHDTVNAVLLGSRQLLSYVKKLSDCYETRKFITVFTTESQ
jgi:hypothetical protein